MSNLNTMPDPFQFLEKISTEELRRLLQEDFDFTGESTPENDAFITKVMEVIAQREESDPSAPDFDPVAGWEDFQKNYYPTENDPILLCDDVQLKELTRKHRVVRSSHQSTSVLRRRIKPSAIVAALMAIFMGMLIVAQAVGFDVFGAVARWTDDAFRFVTTPTSNEVVAFRSALEDQGIPVEYAPTWVPKGFVAEEPQVSTAKNYTIISLQLSNGEKDLLYSVTRYTSQKAIAAIGYEKKAGDAESYMNGKQLFYIFENTDRISAAWSDGEQFTIDICGQISATDMKSIIDSIGG